MASNDLRMSLSGHTGSSDVSSLVTLTGKSIYGKTLSATTEVVQEAYVDDYTFRVATSSSNAHSTASTMNFSVTATNVNNVAYLSEPGDGLTGCTITGNSGTAKFTQNTSPSQLTKTITLTGTTVGGQNVTATTTFTQSAAVETYLRVQYTGGTLSSKSGMTMEFNVEYSGIKGGLNTSKFSVNNGGTLTYNSGTNALGLTYPVNTGTTEVVYTVTCTGTDIYNRTKTATARVPQAMGASRSYIDLGSNFSVPASVSSTTITLNYGYLSGSTVSLVSVEPREGGLFKRSYFDANKTITATTVNITSGTPDQSLTFTLYFNKNTSTTEQNLYYAKATGTGENGREVSDTVNFNQKKAASGGNIIISPDSGSTSSTSGTVEFTIWWENMLANSTISLTATNLTNLSSSSISVDSTGAGSTTVTATKSANNGAKRYLTLDASGTGANSQSVTAQGLFVQDAPTCDLSFVKAEESAAAFNQNTYNGSRVTGTAEFTHTNMSSVNNATVTSGGSWLTVVSTTTGGSSHYVSFSCAVNSGATRTGVIEITGTGVDTESYSSTVNIVQDAGNEVYAAILIEGVNNYTAPNVLASSGQVNYNFSYSNVSNIGTSGASNCSVTANTSTNKLNVKFNENPNTTTRSWGAYITGNTVFGNVVNAHISGIQNGQAIPDGSISVTPDGTSFSYPATSVTFTVAWTNLKANSSITLTRGTGISTISPTDITVGNNTTSSVTITANVLENNTGVARNITLTARGTDGNNVTRSDSGYFVQQAATPSIVVSVVSPAGNIPNSGGTVTFNIQWQHIKQFEGVSAFTAGSVSVLSGPTPSSFVAASGNENATIELGPNTGSAETMYIYVSGHSQSGAVVTGGTSITQAGGYAPPSAKVWVKAGTSAVSVYNNSATSTTVTAFSVSVGNMSGFLANTSTAIASGQTVSMTGIRYPNSGETYYSMFILWSGNNAYENVTTFKWKENGTQRTMTVTGYTVNTGQIPITANTELSDFEVEVKQDTPVATLRFNKAQIEVTNNTGHAIRVASILVEYNYMQCLWRHGSSSTYEDGYWLEDGETVIFPESEMTTPDVVRDPITSSTAFDTYVDKIIINGTRFSNVKQTTVSYWLPRVMHVGDPPMGWWVMGAFTTIATNNNTSLSDTTDVINTGTVPLGSVGRILDNAISITLIEQQ